MTRSPITVERSATMAHAFKIMVEHGFRHLPVVDGDRLVGLVSERELRVVENMKGIDSAFVTVGDFILEPPYAVGPETPVHDVALTMSQRKVGSAIVVDGDKVVGLFTTTDALRVLAELLAPSSNPT
ncbi:CBS domain-containing protein [Chondromyces crocatus]|nr:CBS domain-containing protein [Chondromyces crocatus]